MSLARFFQDQAIRLRRTKWANPVMLAEELYSMFTGVQDDESTGNFQYVPNDGDDSPIEFPGFDNLYIPPLDLSFAEFPSFNSLPEVEQNDTGSGADDGTGGDDAQASGNTTRRTFRTFWNRTVIPGVVVSGSGEDYIVTIYPNGNEAADPDDTTVQESKSVSVKQLQIDPEATIPAGAFAFVFRAVKLRQEIIEVIEDGTARVVSRQTALYQEEIRHFMQVPVWL